MGFKGVFVRANLLGHVARTAICCIPAAFVQMVHYEQLCSGGVAVFVSVKLIA